MSAVYASTDMWTTLCEQNCLSSACSVPWTHPHSSSVVGGGRDHARSAGCLCPISERFCMPWLLHHTSCLSAGGDQTHANLETVVKAITHFQHTYYPQLEPKAFPAFSSLHWNASSVSVVLLVQPSPSSSRRVSYKASEQVCAVAMDTNMALEVIAQSFLHVFISLLLPSHTIQNESLHCQSF